MMFPFIVSLSREIHYYDGSTSTVFILNFFWRELFIDYIRPTRKNDKPFNWTKEIW
jgi:hypothetical protein